MNISKKHFSYYLVPGGLFVIANIYIQQGSVSNDNIAYIIAISYLVGALIIDTLGMIIRKVHRMLVRSNGNETSTGVYDNSNYREMVTEQAMYSNSVISLILIMIVNHNYSTYVLIVILICSIKYFMLDNYIEKLKGRTDVGS